MNPHRPLTVGVTALLAFGVAATGAAADQDVTVSALAEAGSRQFFVEDLSGQTLQNLDLGSSGQGQLFQVRVADRGFLSPSAPFTASAEMTHLYKKDGNSVDHSTKVLSEQLSISYVGTPDVAGVSLGGLPTIRLTGALPTCGELGALLPADSPLRGGSLLGSLLDPLNVLLSGMGLGEAAKPLCTALGGTSTTPLPIAAADAVLVQLQEQTVQPAAKVAAGLPVAVGGSTESGSFDTPSYLGVGAADPNKTTTPARKRKMLRGEANPTFDLNGLLGPVLDGKPLFGNGGLTTVGAVVAALQQSTSTAVSSVGTALAGLSAADQTGILSKATNNVSDLVPTLVSSTLKRISGTYRSFPRLQADLSGAPVGNYTGTMTVTFVQQ